MPRPARRTHVHFGIDIDTHNKISTMSFQGKDFTPAMKQLVMNLKLHFDEERKNHKEVSTRNPTLRTAQGLDIGEITVKRMMAEYRHHEPTLDAVADAAAMGFYVWHWEATVRSERTR